MPVARSEPPDTRVIAHVDLDCFYVQVEQRRNPELKGKPTAVVMYNPWKGGGIIAVGYEARAAGVTRQMRGDDARKVCPDIHLVQVPTHFGKADLTDYRDAGSEVVAVFSRGGVCERASIDEVYLDVTEAAVARLQQCPPDAIENLSPEVLGSHIIGFEEDHDEKMEVKDWLCRSALFASRSDQLLACGAMIIAELRTAAFEETGFTTSAGLAHNKMLAKLASGMHKPAQQTLIPSSGAPILLASLPVKKLKGLGGKLGKAVESDLGIKTIGDLLPYSESKLQDLYGTNTGTWLWRVARGMSGDEVEGRTLPKSHGCGKTFPGVKALRDLTSVAYWLSELAGELQERLDVDLQQNNRSARLLVCHANCQLNKEVDNGGKPFPSKSCAIRYGREKIAHDALMLFKRALSEFCPRAHSLSPAKGEKASSGSKWGVTALRLSANNITDASGTASITQYFAAPVSNIHVASAGDLVKVTTPPSSPSSLHSWSLVSPSGAQSSVQQDELGKSPFWRDNTCTEASMGIESGTSWRSSVEGLDKGIVPSVDSLISGGVELRQASNYLGCDVINPDFTVGPFPLNDTVEAVTHKERQANLFQLDDDSRHGEGCIDYARAVNRPANGAGLSEDSETNPLCTPKFGVPGSPASCVPALQFPEDLSTSSHEDTLVLPIVEGNLELSSQKLGCTNSETRTDTEVIVCSPLEQSMVQVSEPDLRCVIEINAKRDIEISERTTYLDQVCRSPRGATASSSGQDSDSIADREVLENLTPIVSPAKENHLKTASLSSSQPRSLQKATVDNVIPGSTAIQRVGSAGLSKRLVFQRVDDLWERSRPNTQSSPNTKNSSIGSWNYKEEEIDEGVLSELPEEIQHELRNQLRLKRPKTGVKSTISDFFKRNPSTTNG